MIVRLAGQANRCANPGYETGPGRRRPDDPVANPARTSISPDYPVNVKSIKMARQKRAPPAIFPENRAKTTRSSAQKAGSEVEGRTRSEVLPRVRRLG